MQLYHPGFDLDALKRGVPCDKLQQWRGRRKGMDSIRDHIQSGGVYTGKDFTNAQCGKNITQLQQ